MKGNNISIQDVLATIRDPECPVFSIAWVRSSGKKIGSIKEIKAALYGAPKRLGATRSTNLNKASHKLSGTLPIRDMSNNGQYLTPLISHMISFNNLKIIH